MTLCAVPKQTANGFVKFSRNSSKCVRLSLSHSAQRHNCKPVIASPVRCDFCESPLIRKSAPQTRVPAWPIPLKNSILGGEKRIPCHCSRPRRRDTRGQYLQRMSAVSGHEFVAYGNACEHRPIIAFCGEIASGAEASFSTDRMGRVRSLGKTAGEVSARRTGVTVSVAWRWSRSGWTGLDCATRL